MIFHKFSRRSKSVTKRALLAHASRLVRYVVDARPDDARKLASQMNDNYAVDLFRYPGAGAEKVLAVRARNFTSDDTEAQLLELHDLVAEQPAGADLVEHLLLSWDSRDAPSPTQVFTAFDILLEMLGYGNCPVVIGLHRDTGNLHGHAALIRIDAMTGDVVPRAFDGWDIDAGHRAVAVIEDRFPDWHVSPGRTYEVRNERLIHCKSNSDLGTASEPSSWRRAEKSGSNEAKPLSSGIEAKIDFPSRQYEEDTGWKSRTRVALEEAVPILLSAVSWPEAHSRLAIIGIEFKRAKNGTGANFEMGGVKVKASIHDSTSLPALVKRLGAFEPNSVDEPIIPYVPRCLHGNDPKRAEYHAAKRTYADSIRSLIADIRSAETGYRSSVPSRSMDPMSITRSSFPSIDDWLAGAAPSDPASAFGGATGHSGLAAIERMSPSPGSIPGFEAKPMERGIGYRRIGDEYSRPALFDVGNRIYVNDDSDASIRAALVLMSSRLNGKPVSPFGDPDFIKRAKAIAKAEGIDVTNSHVAKIHDGPLSAEIALIERDASPKSPIDVEMRKAAAAALAAQFGKA